MQAIGLGAACDYLSAIGMDKIHQYEMELGGYLYEKVCLPSSQQQQHQRPPTGAGAAAAPAPAVT